uniref:Uncharacterized protein n=1 Tax=Setaria italica TaxID=4555 RepID=K3ZGU1_SETIT
MGTGKAPLISSAWCTFLSTSHCHCYHACQSCLIGSNSSSRMAHGLTSLPDSPRP